MRLSTVLALGASTSALGLVLPQQERLADLRPHPTPEKFLIELAPYETRWVTEEEKWDLKLDGVNFIDVTEELRSGAYPTYHIADVVRYPAEMSQAEAVVPLTEKLSKANMKANLEHFTSFHTRYYKSSTGVESATWLYEQVEALIDGSGAAEYGVTVERFANPWGQFSIIARIPGQSNKTVVLGAHQDSINLFFPSLLAAPGADDDGSGTVTILEAFRALLQSEPIVQGKAPNTIEFHWYSAEEGGLLGSQAIFAQYKKTRRDIKAMLQQDMTGYVQGTLDAGLEESVGVITDFVDQGLTEFIKQIITTYCDIPYVETKCGYACSDHASASRYGYPSAFVIESEFQNSDKKIHTTEDKIEYLSFDHMLQHAKMTYAKEFQIACLTVQRAALVTKALLEQVDKGQLDKSDATPVTIADFAAQALIIAALHHVFPEDEFVGEESSLALRENPELLDRTWELASSIHQYSDNSDDGGVDDALLYSPRSKEEMLDLIDLGAEGKCAGHGRTWVLDPVDGTETFMRGQQYAVCLALVEDGCQKVGVLGCPNLSLATGQVSEEAVDRDGNGYMLSAVTGEGAYLRRMGRTTTTLQAATRIAPVPSVATSREIRFVDSTRITSSSAEQHERLAVALGAAWPPPGDLWSAQMRYVALAVGGCNALVKIPRKETYRSNIWDHAGGMLIAAEVGYTVSDLAGNPVNCGLGRKLSGCYGMIVAPPGIHGRLVEAIKAL
ncbi:hypothetical protein ASPZODRAFT_151948 [Penicilliopsis zonata CBS 506.65]|uniref:Peptide hydrolase n=1 Tax=Penicilliopsis zonata CBS 506.65 TaxID=1073090 RepID=A0A1L9SGT1_9EURO|nr:hypothetical protein ASPZODRAFT_151948 [Penicilliopsis zonata CBS 506.65]OJJ46389.1 hypothetical protein ASPZODRAFT_151948 [Penicilliopsis zonata CBS 506.65]